MICSSGLKLLCYDVVIILLGLNQNIICFPRLNNLTYGWVGRKNILFFPSIIKIADKRDN
jgi:hypothetical protein